MATQTTPRDMAIVFFVAIGLAVLMVFDFWPASVLGVAAICVLLLAERP